MLLLSIVIIFWSLNPLESGRVVKCDIGLGSQFAIYRLNPLESGRVVKSKKPKENGSFESRLNPLESGRVVKYIVLQCYKYIYLKS